MAAGSTSAVLLLLTAAFMLQHRHSFNGYYNRYFAISGAAATLVDDGSSVDAATATSFHGHQLRDGRYSWLGDSAHSNFLPRLGHEHPPQRFPYWRFSWYHNSYSYHLQYASIHECS